MKKIIMLTAALVTLGAVVTDSANAARPFNGWSVGVHGGWNRDNVKNEFDGYDITDVGTVPLNNKDLKSSTGFAGIHFDWTKSQADNYLFGLGFGVGYGFGSKKHTVASGQLAIAADPIAVPPVSAVNASGKIDSELKRKLYAEINGRMGWNFGNRWALYGLVSVRAQQADLRSTASGSGAVDAVAFAPVSESGSEKRVIYGIAPGIGFDVRLDETWSVGAQYKYYFERSKINNELSNHEKTRSHNALVRVSYHF